MDKSFLSGIIEAVLGLFAGGRNSVRAGGVSLNTTALSEAATGVVEAVRLSDEEVLRLTTATLAWMDQQYQIAEEDNEHAIRLKRLTEKITEIDGMQMDFKVYRANVSGAVINAHAYGNGAVRVYTGMMKHLDDDELMGIIGHEIGHVVHDDKKRAMRNAMLTNAGRNMLKSVSGRIGYLSDSEVGEFAHVFMRAQFSQKQELAADDYAMKFCAAYGFDPEGLARALDKIVALSTNQYEKPFVQQLLASHPDSRKRAERAHQKAAKCIQKQ